MNSFNGALSTIAAIVSSFVFAQTSAAESTADTIKAMEDIGIGDKYLIAGDKVKATSIYNEIANNEGVDPTFRYLALSRTAQVNPKPFDYYFGFELVPLAPKKSYKSDTLYINIGGMPVPFTVQRADPIYSDLSINHGIYLYPNIAKSEKSFDWFRLSHQYEHRSDQSEINSITFAAKPHIPVTRLNFIYEYEISRQDKVEDTHTHRFKLLLQNTASEIKFDIETTDLNQALNAPSGATRNAKVQLGANKTLGMYSLRASHERNYFVAPGNDYVLSSIGVERKIAMINGSVSAEYKRKSDSDAKFPVSNARVDELLTASVSKAFSALGKTVVGKAQVSRNISNIDIYSYDQLSLGISTAF